MNAQTATKIEALDILRPGKQWVAYNSKKEPVNPHTGKLGAVDNPHTWGTHQQAEKACHQRNWCKGVGRVFLKEQRVTGIDLDKCIDDRGQLSPYARYVVDLLNSYTEYSPSGKGLHIWVYGSIPKNIGANVEADGESRIEAYDCNRFFTVTGKHLAGTPLTIEHREEQLLALHTETIRRRQAAKKNVTQAKKNAPHAATGDTPYGLAALEREYQAVATSREGSRNTQLNASAYSLGQLVAGGELTDSSVERALLEAAMRVELDDTEAKKTFTSGFEAGKKEPRTAPPKPQPAAAHGNGDNRPPITPTANQLPEPAEVLKYLVQEEWGDSLLFAHLFRGKVIYDHVEKEWYIWQGHYWKRDDFGAIRKYVSGKLAGAYIQTSAKVNEELAEIEVAKGDDDITKARIAKLKKQVQDLQHRAVHLRMLSRCKNVLIFAASQDDMGVTASQWDTNKWILATPNGVVDLRTGAFREGNPTDYIRTTCPTEWQGLHAPAPRFERFLQEIFSDRTEEERLIIIQFLHRLFGYGITGEVREQVFAVLYGEDGRNGKDTLQRAISHALGSASGAISKDVLLDMGRHSAGGATPHLCDLQGKRIAWANEPENGARFNVSQVKDLSGGGEIPVRPLYAKDYYKIQPTHMLVLLTNHKPHADANDSAFWDRLRLITFNVRFVDDPQGEHERKKDASLWDTLEQEASGILAWLVRGCLTWQREGLATPAIILQDGKQYREEEDNIALFIKECCTTSNPHAKARGSELYTAYKTWCEVGSMHPFKITNFGMMVSKRFKKDKDMKGVYYIGLGILSPDDMKGSLQENEDYEGSKNNPSYPINQPVEHHDMVQASTDYEGYEYQKQETPKKYDLSPSQGVLSEKGIHTLHNDVAQSTISPLVEPNEGVCIPPSDTLHNSLYESAYYRDMVGWLEKYGKSRPEQPCSKCGTNAWWPHWHQGERKWGCANCRSDVLNHH